MKRDLSPEARGVLVALTSLGKIKHLDRISLELAEAGLAEMRGGQLEINDRGRSFGKAMMQRPKQIAEVWKAQAKRHKPH